MTTQQLLSPAWYRVAGLKPRLRSHMRIHRHEYRGERWYVVEDRISRRAHRFNPAACFVIGLMNGRRSMQEIWDATVRRFGEETPTQQEIIQLLGQLHAGDIMQCEIAPDVDDLISRAERISRRGALAKLLSPLAVKIPLFDPDRFLERWRPWYSHFFGPAGAVLWFAVVGWGVFTAAQHWDELTHDISNRVLAPHNLIILGLVFPLLKALHEFGHAAAVKAWGGEVHEVGIMFLVLMPIPYVDASAANSFSRKQRRVLVGAAGMVVEVFAASLALFLWLEMQPGILRAVLFNVMLIAGVSTVLFNANPLLRFDGYYIFSDLLEIPNLRTRANQFLRLLVQRRLFGLDIAAPDTTLRERSWLFFFAIASFVYRVSITFAIAIFVAGHYLFIGVILGIWAILMGFVMPLVTLIGYIGWSPRLRRDRPRVIFTTIAVAVLAYLVLFVVPVPAWTNAQGVIWLPEQSSVRGGADGFITRVIATPGTHVREGDPLIATMDPALAPRIRELEAKQAELEARYQSEMREQLVRAQITREQLKTVAADLHLAQERQADLLVRSPGNGVFTVSANPADLPGRFIKQGEPLGYVIPETMVTARVLVPQERVDLVRTRTKAVYVRLAERPSETIPARILREVPRASDRLPSIALSQAGGGDVALDPTASREARSLQTHFEFEIALPVAEPVGYGGRVYVRFEHGAESIASQVWRWMRQLFLQRLTI